MITLKIIGNRIEVARKNIPLSQKELAEKLQQKKINMSRETISKIENGTRAVTAIELKAICEILNVDQQEILYEEEEKDIVTLFRSTENVTEECIEEIEEIQEFIKSFIRLKRL